MVTKVGRRIKKRRNSSAVAESWSKQANWLLKTIINLDESPTAHGLKWQHRMILHYNMQYQTLCKRVPKSCQTLREQCDREINAILRSYDEKMR